ncbi:unnamed protein product [Cylindrotheca closterium]|uniref:Uncharacterized protein n=1 Tax=Cylindrotheca closterium TaxID=2856 RepID=A0AAD2CR87_9STRA|nr:unnamed protein product [Cylindrotheca closterium]
MFALVSRTGTRIVHSSHAILSQISSRSSSSSQRDLPDLAFVLENFTIHDVENRENGSTEYILLPPEKTLSDISADPSVKFASIFRHRNILFAARSFHDQYSLEDICLPLVEIALKEAGENGEQPQAVASLNGLCDWVDSAIRGNIHSEELSRLQQNDQASFEAVQAIATGIPRSGHSVVGEGTYLDGTAGWKALSVEFLLQGMSKECNLYKQRNARLVSIEHMADRSPAYLQSAGGAMARLFFL